MTQDPEEKQCWTQAQGPASNHVDSQRLGRGQSHLHCKALFGQDHVIVLIATLAL